MEEKWKKRFNIDITKSKTTREYEFRTFLKEYKFFTFDNVQGSKNKNSQYAKMFFLHNILYRLRVVGQIRKKLPTIRTINEI